MTTQSTISIDYLFSDAALLYVSGITPEGQGVLLNQGDDGIWRSDDIRGEYRHPEDAREVAAAFLG